MYSSSRTGFPYGIEKEWWCKANPTDFWEVCVPWKMQLKERWLGILNKTGSAGPRQRQRWCRLSSVCVNTDLDYLQPRWVILFYWLPKLSESGPAFLQVSQILQLTVCSRHWIHYLQLLKADLAQLNASGSFEISRDGLSMPIRWSLCKPDKSWRLVLHTK